MCEMLMEKCKIEFGHKANILTPHEAQLAIVKGAVLFGHNPLPISSRFARFTYGICNWMRFKAGVHDPKKKVVDDEGEEMCKDCFSVFITKDEEVKTSEQRIFYYAPACKGQTSVDFTLYKVGRSKVKYIDESGVVQVILCSTNGPLGDSLEVRVTFGHTEILVEARDKSKGENFPVRTTVDFMSR